MILEGNKIILKEYFFPHFLCIETLEIPNDGNLLISYNNVYKDRVKANGFLYKLCPTLMRKYNLSKREYSGATSHIYDPRIIRGMHLKYQKRWHSFGTMLTKPDYDEILALILAQRAKWEKVHPEDAIAPEPEDSETHTVDSPSQ
ncbi:MAG: hypothetical protein LBR17_05255 [Bacteroidales bacterium]|nr:hypothetical protein [Bacteroidales bacterium]